MAAVLCPPLKLLRCVPLGRAEIAALALPLLLLPEM